MANNVAVPRADIALPWDAEVEDPIATLAQARAECGDTFVVPSDAGDWWFVFGPVGVRSFYDLAEQDASKGVADWQMLRRKLPGEIFAGRRTLPHELWTRAGTQTYLAALDAAIAVSFTELGAAGEFDLFAWTRRLGHRMGLASWAGLVPEATPAFDRLIELLDRLDGSAAFVDPASTRAVAASDYRDERATLAELVAWFAPRLCEQRSVAGDDLFATIVERWSDTTGSARDTGIVHDVVLIHLGSMSNLFAALGWTVGHLLLHPDVGDRVRAGEAGLAERCALESTRIAQRSLMSRAVLRPLRLSTDIGLHEVSRGSSIATLLALTNTSAAATLTDYDPQRWERRRLRDGDALAARELVTTFGHGAHTCPAQPFSLAAMAKAATALLNHYEMSPDFDALTPRRGQIGGVARSEFACRVRYRLR